MQFTLRKIYTGTHAATDQKLPVSLSYTSLYAPSSDVSRPMEALWAGVKSKRWTIPLQKLLDQVMNNQQERSMNNELNPSYTPPKIINYIIIYNTCKDEQMSCKNIKNNQSQVKGKRGPKANGALKEGEAREILRSSVRWDELSANSNGCWLENRKEWNF